MARALSRLASINEASHADLRAEIAHHERMYQTGKASDRSDERRVADFANDLGIAQETLGRLTLAIARFSDTLESAEQHLGPEHSNTLASRNNLAMAYRQAGRLDKAIPSTKKR